MNGIIDELILIDRGGMRGILESFPSQFYIPFVPQEVQDIPFPARMVLLSMGGSAIGCDIFKTYMKTFSPFHVQVIRGYRLPIWIDSDTLVVAVSCSGNTKETLDLFRQARDRTPPLVVISRGGELGKLAEEWSVPFIRLTGEYPPRSSLGLIFSALLGLCHKLGILPSQEEALSEARNIMEELTKKFHPPGGGEALRLAERLMGRMPVIYAGDPFLRAVAMRWKEQFNENSKVPAFMNYFPELAHNEMEGWQEGGDLFHLVILRDAMESPLQQRAISVSKGMLRDKGISLDEVVAVGRGLMARLLSLVYLGDWVSYYLALLRGVDPMPIPFIEEFKRRL